MVAQLNGAMRKIKLDEALLHKLWTWKFDQITAVSRDPFFAKFNGFIKTLAEIFMYLIIVTVTLFEEALEEEEEEDKEDEEHALARKRF